MNRRGSPRPAVRPGASEVCSLERTARTRRPLPSNRAGRADRKQQPGARCGHGPVTRIDRKLPGRAPRRARSMHGHIAPLGVLRRSGCHASARSGRKAGPARDRSRGVRDLLHNADACRRPAKLHRPGECRGGVRSAHALADAGHLNRAGVRCEGDQRNELNNRQCHNPSPFLNLELSVDSPHIRAGDVVVAENARRRF